MPKRWTQPRSTVNLLEKPTLRGYGRKEMYKTESLESTPVATRWHQNNSFASNCNSLLTSKAMSLSVQFKSPRNHCL